jgi:hypothetical protein
VQSRFKRCIHSGTNSYRKLRFFKLRKSRDGLPVHFLSFRVKCSSQGFLQEHETCYRTIMKRRHLNYLLSRRHLYFRKIQGQDAQDCFKNKKAPRSLRVYHKLLQEHFNSFQRTGILGFLFNSKDMIISVPSQH